MKQDYIVKQGDSLSGISNTLGYNLDLIIKANPNIKDPSKIWVGLNIKLPEKSLELTINLSYEKAGKYINKKKDGQQYTHCVNQLSSIDNWEDQRWGMMDKVSSLFNNKYEEGGMIDNTRNFYKPVPKRNMFEEGGYLDNPSFSHGGEFSNGIVKIQNGGTHEENPYGGVMYGTDEQGNPNLLEEGEVVYKDFVFSNSLVLDDEDLEASNISKKYLGKTFAYVAEQLQKESEERPYDPISLNGLSQNMNELFIAQETKKIIQQEDDMFQQQMDNPELYEEEVPEEPMYDMQGMSDFQYEEPSGGLESLMGGI